MKIYDVTRPLYPNMYTYPGDPKFEIEQLRSGESYISALRLGTHTGTHIDAPAHYLLGAKTIDRVSLDKLVTKAELVSFGALFSNKTTAVLYRSGFFGTEYPVLYPDEAESLISAGVLVVGTDTPSVGDDEVHRILFKAGVTVIELMDFTGVPDGIYQMVALPLKIRGADAAPARIILIDSEDNDDSP